MAVEITIKVYKTLREKLGWKTRKLLFDEPLTIKGMLEKLPDLAKAIREYEEKGYAPLIMVNGRRIEFINGYNTRLRNGDTITVFPPSAGG